MAVVMLAAVFVVPAEGAQSARRTPADVLDAANAVRRAGCEQRAGLAEPLRRSAPLDRVAARWSNGGSLQAAQDAEPYRVRGSVSVKLPNLESRSAMREILASIQCRALTDPAFLEVGIEVRGNMAWMVVAVPYHVPTSAEATQIADEVLDLVNVARSRARRCGKESFPSVPPLRQSTLLAQVAATQARDMARNNFLAHEGSDGSQPGQRAQRAGYRWRNVGENVAGGPSSAQEVVDGWLASPHHCTNIMSPDYTEMGVAFAAREGTQFVTYWSQLFGRPR